MESSSLNRVTLFLDTNSKLNLALASFDDEIILLFFSVALVNGTVFRQGTYLTYAQTRLIMGLILTKPILSHHMSLASVSLELVQI